jgi:predicted ATPase
MLLSVLNPALQQALRTQTPDIAAIPTGLTADWLHLVSRRAGSWRGPTPPRTPLLGRAAQVAEVAELIREVPVLVLTGPGGIGKSRLALAAAEQLRSWFAGGIGVYEMSRIPRETDTDPQTAADRALGGVQDLLPAGDAQFGRRQLLVLDNTEHLPETTALLVERLLDGPTAPRILITSRRPPRLNGCGVWEVPALPIESAAELMLERARSSCPTLDLGSAHDQVFALCYELDRLPRLLEFAAHRLRIVSLASLLSDDRVLRLLGSADIATPPHQRSLESSLRWSLDLLEERHRLFLIRMSRLTGPFTLESFGGSDPDSEGPAGAGAVELLSDLAESSLLHVERGVQYRYRMLSHVRAYFAGRQQATVLSIPTLGDSRARTA